MEQLESDKFVQVHMKKIIISIIFIILFIMIYFGREHIERNLSIKYINSSIHSTSLHNNQFEVVLSYYKEDVHFVARFIQYLRNVSNLQKLKPYIIIYNKNSKINNTYLKTILKVDMVQQLPNLGREGATYLYHIIENYDKLANHILFCQAGVEGINNRGLEDWLLHRLDKQFNSSVGYMPLVGMKWMVTFNCGKWGGVNMERLPQLWGIIEQTLCPPGKQAVSQNLYLDKIFHLKEYIYIGSISRTVSC